MLSWLMCANHELILCDYIILECYDVAKKRFPSKLQVLDRLLSRLRYDLVSTPRVGEIKMRDVKDQPILYAAIENNVDILITGDKHFLELVIETPHILLPAEYKNLFMV